MISRFSWQWRGLLAVPFSLGLIALLRWSGALQSYSLETFDLYMRWRKPHLPDERIAIVGIDEEDIHWVGSYPFSDAIYAQLLQKLIEMNPRAIGLDIYRDVPIKEGDADLTEVFTNHDNIIGIEKVVGNQPWQKVAPPPILKSKNQVGANDLPVDIDGKVRRVFITLKSEGETIPSLGAYLAAMYLDAEGVEADYWEQFPSFQGNNGGYVRADDLGYQIILNYRGPSRQFEIVSLRDILENRVEDDWAKDRIILIGNVSESSNDLLRIPHTTSANSRMAGVEIHANLVSQIISTVIDNYIVIKTLPKPIEWLWIGFWTLGGTAIVWKQRYVIFKGFQSIWLIAPTLAIILLSYGAFVSGYWIPVVPTVLGLWISQLVVIAYMGYKAATIRHTFGRYLDGKVVANLIENRESLKIGGEKQEITILVSDLRGFTATSEKLPPEKIINIINYYFEEMAEVISEYEGMIDEFLGDGILVLFGVPIKQEDDAVRAVSCAIAMQQRLNQVNQTLSQKYTNFSPLEMGIGINTGEVIVGNIGSEKRTKYGVVGNTINLTYRIESCTIGGQIYISEKTREEVEKNQHQIEIYQSISKHFKGAKQPQTIYDLKAIIGKDVLSLETEVEKFYCLSEPKPLTYQVLQGKDIDSNQFPGTLEEISAKRAIIRYELAEQEYILTPLTNIMLNFLDSDLGNSQEAIYAKIIVKHQQNQRLEIAFTSIPSQVKINLDNLYQNLQSLQEE